MGNAVSTILKDGYAFKPGMAALIKCAESAQRSAGKASQDTLALEDAIRRARSANGKPVNEKLYCAAMRQLRTEIRKLKDVPEAKLDCLNYYPADVW